MVGATARRAPPTRALPARLRHELMTGAMALAFDDTFHVMVAAPTQPADTDASLPAWGACSPTTSSMGIVMGIVMGVVMGVVMGIGMGPPGAVTTVGVVTCWGARRVGRNRAPPRPASVPRAPLSTCWREWARVVHP